MSDSKIKIPIFKEGDDMTEYIERVKLLQLKSQCKSHDIVLEFINKLFKLSKNNTLEKLSDFKGISEKFFHNTNKKVIDDYKKDIKNIIYMDVTTETDVFYIIRRLLGKIGYKLISKTISGNVYYSIVLK